LINFKTQKMDFLINNFDLIMLFGGFLVGIILLLRGIFCYYSLWGVSNFWEGILSFGMGFLMGLILFFILLKFLLFAFAGQPLS